MDEHGSQNQHLKTLGDHMVLGSEQYPTHHSANCDLSQRQICFSPAQSELAIPKNTTGRLPESWPGPEVACAVGSAAPNSVRSVSAQRVVRADRA